MVEVLRSTTSSLIGESPLRVLQKSIDELRVRTNKLQTVELESFLQRVQQYTLHDTHLKFSEIKQELDGAMEIIRIMSEKNHSVQLRSNEVAEFSTLSKTVPKYKPNITPDIFECELQRCIDNINHIISNEQFNNTPINALQSLLRMMSTKTGMTSNTTNCDIIHLINALESAIDGAIIVMNTATQYTRQVSYNDYNESHIAITKKNIDPSKFKVNISSDGITELMVGYEGLITDSVVTLLTNAIDYTKIDTIEQTIEQQLLEHITQLTEYIKTQQSIPDTGLNTSILRSKIKLFVCNWNTFQQYKYRYYYHFIYCIYCITNNNTQLRSNFRYVDVKILSHYLGILDDITKRFNDSTNSDIIQYFNICHYHTIKTLRKFFKFFGRVLEPTQIIDVFNCQEDVKQSFIIFNQFKELLDLYEEKIMKK